MMRATTPVILSECMKKYKYACIYIDLVVILGGGVKTTGDDGSVAVSLNKASVVDETSHVLCATVVELGR